MYKKNKKNKKNSDCCLLHSLKAGGDSRIYSTSPDSLLSVTPPPSINPVDNKDYIDVCLLDLPYKVPF